MNNKRFEVMDYFDSENKPIKAIRDTETTEIYSMDNELESNSTCGLLNALHEEKEFYKNIVEEISYSLIDYNRLEINKELNEHINSVNTLEEFKEWINKGKEEFKKEYQWLK